MTVQEAMQKRRSIRKFTDEAVSPQMIDTLLHAAMSGPSACNARPWEFFVVTNPDKLNALKGATHFTKITAPLAIIVCGNLSHALPMNLGDFWVQDCSAATENILLQAVELGLGSVWCGIYPQKRAQENVAEMLELKDNLIPLNILWIGHPAETQAERDQYDAELVHFVK